QGMWEGAEGPGAVWVRSPGGRRERPPREDAARHGRQERHARQRRIAPGGPGAELSADGGGYGITMRSISARAQRPAFPLAREFFPRDEESVVTPVPVHGKVA